MNITDECNVIFSLFNAPEEVYIVGNCEALGNWSPDQAIRLIHIESSSKTLLPIKILRESRLEYKYISRANGQVVWENMPNRRLTVKNNIFVEDFYNSPVSKVDYSQKRFEVLRRNSSEHKFEKIYSDASSVIIVSMHLPVTLTKTPEGYEISTSNSLWHSQLFSVYDQLFEFIWIGYAGLEVPEEDQEQVSRLLKPFHCVPVFIPEDTLKLHRSYCEETLFHVLNNQIDLKCPISSERNTQQWEGYKILNILFNEVLFGLLTEQMIWIHGSELLLLPSLLSKKVRDPPNIGFYFHRPFPSSEIFRILPHKTAILNAIGCCDIIGFQIFEHATHFIGTCKRILGVDTGTSKDGNIFLNYYGRSINVYIGHIGICPDIIESIKNQADYQTLKSSLTEKYKQYLVILSIDHLTPSSGFLLKLKAIHQIVSSKKKKIEKVVFLNIFISYSESFEIDQKSLNLVQEINQLAGRPLIQIEHKKITQHERYALMEISSGLVISSLREGMNLLPFEFLQLKKFKNSGIVLSEFAGCSVLLSSPFKVNPLDTNSFEAAILDLINYIPNKKKLNKDLQYIKTKNTAYWAKDFASQIYASKKKTHKFKYESIGMNDTLRVMAISKNFSKLDEFEVLSAYKNCKNRVLIFGVDGTLMSSAKEHEIPSHKILGILEEICGDAKNTVMIISGRERAFLSKWFGSVPNLNLLAEHGAYIKYKSDQWAAQVSDCETWKQLAKKVIESHVERIEGSFVTCKETSVVFDYREAESLFGQWQAKDIVSHLERLLFSHDCQVIQGEGYVEVKPSGIDKGSMLCKVLQNIFKEKGPVDFLLAVGNDDSSEKMFKVVKRLKKRSCEILNPEAKVFTCTFGVKPSEALFYFLNPDEVLKLAESLGSSKRFHSLGNLHPRHSNHHFKSINISNFQRTRRDSEDYSVPLSPYFK